MPFDFSPGQIPKGIPKWQYDAFRSLATGLHSTQSGFASIVRGEAPNGSGAPLVDLAPYLYLPGRMGGQTVQGIDNLYPAVTFNTQASGLTTVGGLGYAYIGLSHANTPMLQITPLLNNGSTIDLAFNLYAAGFLFVSSTNTTAGIRFAFSANNTFIQCGRVQSDTTVSNKNMQLGGMNAECGSSLALVFNITAFSSAGTGTDGVARVGVDTSPILNTGTSAGSQPVFATKAMPGAGVQYDKAFVAVTGIAHPATDTAAARIMFFDLQNGTGNGGDSSSSIFSIDRWGRLIIKNPGNGAISSCIDGNSYAFRVSDGQDSSTAHQLVAISGQNRWSDGAAKATTSFQIGADWASTGKWSVIECGNRASTSTGLPFDRLGISSLVTMISDAASTASGSLIPPTAILHVRGTVADASVILKIATSRAGQSGDLLQAIGSAGTALAGLNYAGAYYLVAGKGAGLVYTSDANGLGSWQANAALAQTSKLLSTTHTDTLAADPVQGDLIVANATPAWSRLAKSATNGHVLTMVAGAPAWAAPAASGGQLPVGAIYITTVATNPSDAGVLGYGTWTAFGSGRVLIGVDAGDTDFDTVEETGGAKTVASAGSTGAGSSHTHSVTSDVTLADHDTPTIDTISSGGVKIGTGTASAASQTHSHILNPLSAHAVTNHAVTSGAEAAHTHAFTGSATSVVQPYITVYMWKRTA